MSGEVQKIIHALHEQAVILYPTEAVWGMGCDPFSQDAVDKLLQLKDRPIEKGLILLVSSWEQVHDLVDQTLPVCTDKIKASWPGPTTWVFPASDSVPEWVQGAQEGIALRMPSYPPLLELLRAWGKPLISTSANLSGQSMCTTQAEAQSMFPQLPILSGECEGRAGVSAVIDAVTGECYRSA